MNIRHSYNVHEESDDTFLVGGTATFAFNRTAHRVMSTGQDDTGLGRWSWIVLRGRSNLQLRILTFYRPVFNASGITSTYNQHRRYWAQHNDDTCPRLKFNQDLISAIKHWLEAGDSLIIGGDLNESVITSTFSHSLRELGLVEINTARHGNNPPPTFNRGRHPIDGIFVSPSLAFCGCGYLAPEDGIPSDHRMLWLDVPHALAFGIDLPSPVRPQMRRLQCIDPRVVSNYNSRYLALIHSSQLLIRANILNDNIMNSTSNEWQAEWEAIDKERVHAMLISEKQCRKLKAGQVPWSPALQEAIDTVTYWSLYLKRKSGRKISSKLLARLRRAAHITEISLDPQATLRQAIATYRSVKKDAQSNRVQWLERLAAAKAQIQGGEVARHISSLIRLEAQRRENRMCRQILRRHINDRVHMVLKPIAPQQWQECYSPEDIEGACLEENLRRFRQASNTPFLVPPLAQIIDPLALNTNAQKILNGSFNTPPGIDWHTARLITGLLRPTIATQQQIATQLTPDEHSSGWRKAREHTTSGLSGIHFGHFISGAHHPEISLFETLMSSMPFRTGYSPNRWRNGVDVAILKKAGDYRVESLRTLTLLEADFNYMNKVLGRRMMSNAESLNLIAQEQYGSRQHKSAADHALNKRLMFDISRQTRRPLALCSNDAKSCYDRILWPIASLSMQRVGVPPAPIKMLFTTLAHMNHRVSTIYGVSQQQFYSGDYSDMHGVGQGNGASPAIWAVVSTPLLNIQREEGFGASFDAPLSSQAFTISGFAFVDDTDLVQSDSSLDVNSTIQKMQQALDCWSGTLRATGGALVPEKSHWVLISFIWKNGKWKYASSSQSPGDLLMQDAAGRRTPISRIEPTHSRRTLGVRLAADGSDTGEIEYLRQCSQEWADRIRNGHLPRQLVWRALSTMLWPRLAYPLVATTLSQTDSRHVMAPALLAGLSASGMVGKFPRALVHGPTTSGGLGLIDLYHEQGWRHIIAAIHHGSNDESITGKLIRSSIQYTKIELGLPGPLFSHPYQIVRHILTPSWIQHLWKFLWEHSMSITEDTPSLQLQRVNDQFLIEGFIRLGFRGGDLAALNRCRLFLRVTTLSDIVTGRGSHITETAKLGQYDPDIPRSHSWPEQSKPPACDWGIWRLALASWCSNSPALRLPVSLGDWCCPKHPLLAWLWSPSSEHLYRQINSTSWVHFRRLPSRSRRSVSSRYDIQGHPISSDQIPKDVQRGCARIHKGTIHVSGFAPARSIRTSIPSSSIPEILQQAPLSRSWTYNDWHWTPAVSNLPTSLLAGSCWAVSDGSYKENVGTASWIIVDADGTEFLTGSLRVPGPKEYQCPLRSEIAGIYAIINVLHLISTELHLPEGQVTIGCDCTFALNKCFTQQRLSPRTPHYDLIASSQRLRSTSNIRWISHYIPSHQERTSQPLDAWSQLNIKMDSQAKAARTLTLDTLMFDSPTFGEPWALCITGKKQPHLDKAAVHHHLAHRPTQQFWSKKFAWSPTTSANINWDSLSTALTKAPFSRRIWVLKSASGFNATGKNLKRWKLTTHDQCPRCGQSEDSPHILLCPAPHIRDKWNASLQDLEQWLQSVHTPPTTIDLILHTLRSWISLIPTHPIHHHDSRTQPILDPHTNPAYAALFGFIPKQWSHHPIASLPPRLKNHKWWTVALIQKLWNISWDMWADRNGYLHSTATVNASLNDQIRAEYLKPTSQRPTSLQRWFDPPLDDLLRRSKSQKKLGSNILRYSLKLVIRRKPKACLAVVI